MTKKEKLNYFLKIFSAVILSGIVFAGVSFIYLKQNEEKSLAEAKDYTVPYEAPSPENAGLLFTFPYGNSCLIYLDFEKKGVTAITLREFDTEQKNVYGYSVDYTLNCDFDMIEGLVDMSGGVVLDYTGEELRYTGSQIVAVLSENSDAYDVLVDVLPQILNGIQKNGFSKSDFVYIIENSDTNLKLTDCFVWPEYIEDMLKNLTIIN